jgi:hypothetical protein
MVAGKLIRMFDSRLSLTARANVRNESKPCLDNLRYPPQPFSLPGLLRKTSKINLKHACLSRLTAKGRIPFRMLQILWPGFAK